MMTAKLIVSGLAAEPVQRVSNSGKVLLDISVAHNERVRDKQTGEWSNVKDQDGNEIVFWTRATFFDEQATFLASVISKGDRIELEGEPRVRAYTDKSGNARAGVELRGAVVKTLPRAPRGGGSNAGWGAPAGVDASGPVNGAQNGFGGGGFGEPF